MEEFENMVRALRREVDSLQSEPRNPTPSEVLRVIDGMVRALEMLPHR